MDFLFKWLLSRQMILIVGILFCIILLLGMSSNIFQDDEVKKLTIQLLDDINQCYLSGEVEKLDEYFNTDDLYGRWAYEYAERKVKYMKDWSGRQGIVFNDINSDYRIYNINGRDNRYGLTVRSIDGYCYNYPHEPEKNNCFQITVYHYMTIEFIKDTWVITKDWVSDPMCDNLYIRDNETTEVAEFINNVIPENYELKGSRKKAVEYADKYSNADPDSSYNNKYRNYNSVGGDCANFTSQILFEGGKFKKNSIWNYDKGGSIAWIKALDLTQYLLYHGKASKIAVGSYNDVYKAAYNLQPGDIVAYEEKDDIKHVSVVTGYDSRGYPLVNCHNVDRHHVPWDIGWNRKGITFWLIRVHY